MKTYFLPFQILGIVVILSMVLPMNSFSQGEIDAWMQNHFQYEYYKWAASATKQEALRKRGTNQFETLNVQAAEYDKKATELYPLISIRPDYNKYAQPPSFSSKEECEQYRIEIQKKLDEARKLDGEIGRQRPVVHPETMDEVNTYMNWFRKWRPYGLQWAPLYRAKFDQCKCYAIKYEPVVQEFDRCAKCKECIPLAIEGNQVTAEVAAAKTEEEIKRSWERRKVWSDKVRASGCEGFMNQDLSCDRFCKDQQHSGNIQNQDPINDYSIMIETNPITGSSYEGVIADGVSAIPIMLEIPGNSSISFSLKHGSIKNSRDPLSSTLNNTIPLINGKAEVFYHPPKYLDMSGGVGQFEASYFDNGKRYFFVNDQVVFSYSTPNGSDSKQIEVKVCPTPILFIHGFLGDQTTWKEMSRQLNEFGYTGWEFDFKFGDQSIETQSALIPNYTHSILVNYYAHDNIKGSKVDAICHSMGGIIARYYVRNYRDYNNDIRKLIMVGTPNHGVTFAGRVLGNMASQEYYKYHQLASYELYENSNFMALLNRKEAEGNHLKKGVQYGNIYVALTDHITEEISAYLEGVKEFVIDNSLHSTALWKLGFQGPVITQESRVLKKLKEWLEEDIRPGQLYGLRAEVVPVSYDQYYQNWVQTYDLNGQLEPMKQINSRRKLEPYSYVITGENSQTYINFWMGQQTLGGIMLQPNSKIYIGNFTNKYIRADIDEGRFLFNSLEHNEETGRFIVLAEKTGFSDYDETPQLPKAVITNVNTIFTIDNDGDNLNVHSIEGNVKIDKPEIEQSITVSNGQTAKVSKNTVQRTYEPVEKWWEDFDYRNMGLNLAHSNTGSGIYGNEWKIQTIPGSASDIQNAVTTELNNNRTPLGFSRADNSSNILYIESNPFNITNWNMEWYQDVNQLQNGLNTNMTNGYIPMGISFSDYFYVFYVMCDVKGNNWQIVESVPDLQTVSQDIQPYIDQSYVPFGITVYENEYYTLLVEIPGNPGMKWSIEGYSNNAQDIKAGVEKNVANDMVPFGFLKEGNIVNVLYVKF